APVWRAGNRSTAMIQQHDKGRQVLVLCAQTKSNPGAEAWITLANEPGVHLEKSGAMGKAIGVTAAQNGNVIDALPQLRNTGGNRAKTAMPDGRHCANLCEDPSSVPGLRILKSGSLSRLGMGWPVRLTSAGLGPHVSIWRGPPYMKRNMTDFALGEKWDFF